MGFRPPQALRCRSRGRRPHAGAPSRRAGLAQSPGPGRLPGAPPRPPLTAQDGGDSLSVSSCPGPRRRTASPEDRAPRALPKREPHTFPRARPRLSVEYRGSSTCSKPDEAAPEPRAPAGLFPEAAASSCGAAFHSREHPPLTAAKRSAVFRAQWGSRGARGPRAPSSTPPAPVSCPACLPGPSSWSRLGGTLGREQRGAACARGGGGVGGVIGCSAPAGVEAQGET